MPVLQCHHAHPLYWQATSRHCLFSCAAGWGQALVFSRPCCLCQAFWLGAERVSSIRLGTAPAKQTAGELCGCHLFDNNGMA